MWCGVVQVVREVVAPPVRPGDRVIVLDAGANTLSLFSRHCSRPSPIVLGVRFDEEEGTGAGDGRLRVAVLRAAETEDDVLRFWG